MLERESEEYNMHRHWDLVQCSRFEIIVWVQKRSSDVYFAELERARDQKDKKGVAL